MSENAHNAEPAKSPRIAGGAGTALEPRQLASDISREMVRLYTRRLGRGPTKARTTANSNVLLVVFQDTLTKSEMTLLEDGRGEAVVATRMSISSAMRTEATEIVESLTNRRVTAYLASLDPDANVASIVFLLDPIAESGKVVVAEQSGNGEPHSSDGGLPSGERSGFDA